MPLLLCIIIGVLLRPHISLEPIMAVAGGIFLFISSSEIQLRQPVGERSLVLKLWLGAFLPPFIVGYFMSSLILGVALAVSAVPVVIKIMQELGWGGTLRAQRIILTAVLCDIAAWLLFFLVLPKESYSQWLTSHWSLLMFFVGLGVAYQWPTFLTKVPWLSKANQWVIAPLFFIGVGQALDLSVDLDYQFLGRLIVAATLSKTLGIWLMAKLSGMERSEIFPTAISLNARGAMEIIMAKFALAAGLISNQMFVSLVAMALATSLMVKPFIRTFTKTVPET